VDGSGLVQVERSCYAATPAAQYSAVTVRIFDHALKRVLGDHAAQQEAGDAADPMRLQQSGTHIRAIGEYQAFLEHYAAKPDHEPLTDAP
jgi:hypothetical protein